MKNYLKKVGIGVFALGIMCASAQKKYELKFNPKGGTEYNIPVNMKMTMNQMGMDIPMDMFIESHYAFADKGSDKELTLYYSKMTFKMDAMGQKIAMDSDSSGASNESLKKITNTKIVCLFDKNGNLISISGSDSLTSKLGEQNPMSKSLGEDAIKSSLAQNFNIYPKEKIAVGESWKTAFTFKSGISMKSDNTFTLEKVEGNTAYIKVQSNILSDSAQKITQNGMDMEMELKGTQNGTMELDIPTGIFKVYKIQQLLDGKVNAMGQDIPINIKSDINAVATKIK